MWREEITVNTWLYSLWYGESYMATYDPYVSNELLNCLQDGVLLLTKELQSPSVLAALPDERMPFEPNHGSIFQPPLHVLRHADESQALSIACPAAGPPAVESIQTAWLSSHSYHF